MARAIAASSGAAASKAIAESVISRTRFQNRPDAGSSLLVQRQYGHVAEILQGQLTWFMARRMGRLTVIVIKIRNDPDVEPVAARFADHPFRQVAPVRNRQDDFVHEFAARDAGKVFHPAEHIARHQFAFVQEAHDGATVDVLPLQDCGQLAPHGPRSHDENIPPLPALAASSRGLARPSHPFESGARRGRGSVPCE